MRYNIFFLFFLLFISCKEKKNKFIVNFNNSKIELIFSKNKNFIRYDDTIPVIFHIHNIDLSKLRIVALGLSIRKINDSMLAGKLFIKEDYKKFANEFIIKDTLYVKIYKIDDSFIQKGIIKIPLKK